jgi:MFS family permease
MKSVFRALKYRSYRLFFFGQGVSLLGMWMSRVAIGWLVYRLTHSAFLLGAVVFASLIPSFFLGFLAGVLADRWDRRRILIVTQITLMSQALIFAFLTLTGRITMDQILLLSVIQGLINAFDIPARQSFVAEMIENKEDLGNAIALNATMFNGARMIGPVIAGFLIAWTGEGGCFLLDAASYLAVIAALFSMKSKAPAPRSVPARVLDDLKDGLRYVRDSAPIRAILMMVAWGSLTGMSYHVLFPVFAKDILKSGPHALGFLTSSAGFGALLGGFYLASRKDIRTFGRAIVGGSCLGGLGLILFAWTDSQISASLCVFTAGFGIMVQLASCNTLLQTIVADDKRGRIMSFYSMAFMGMAPVGSLLAGALTSLVGVPVTVLILGVLCLLFSFLFAPTLSALKDAVRFAAAGSVDVEVVSGVDAEAQFSTPRD